MKKHVLSPTTNRAFELTRDPETGCYTDYEKLDGVYTQNHSGVNTGLTTRPGDRRKVDDI